MQKGLQKEKTQKTFQFLKVFFTAVLLSSFTSSLWAHEISPENWMENLYKKLPETRLRDIIIPGTHNSGSYGITKRSPLAPGASKLLAVAKRTASNWAKTQNLTILEQLKKGIRHIDLRIAKHRGQFVLVHGLVSVPLKEVLKDLRIWGIAHPKEIVFIEIVPSSSAPEDVKVLHRELTKELGTFLAFPLLPPNQLTFFDLWEKEKGRPFILLTPPFLKKLSPRYWSKKKVLHSLWTNTQNKTDLMDQLLYGNQRGPGLYNQDLSKFYASELTFTPVTKTIARGLFRIKAPKNLSQLSKPLYERPKKAIDLWLQKELAVNIIKMDFFEKTNLVSACLEANQNVIIQGGKKWH